MELVDQERHNYKALTVKIMLVKNNDKILEIVEREKQNTHHFLLESTRHLRALKKYRVRLI